MKKTVFAVVCGCFMLCAVSQGALMNASFEDPDLDPGVKVNGVTDWWDSASLYTKTVDDGDENTPLTPYGDNWAQLGRGRWIYQQIGTFTENTTYEITFLLGQPSDKAIAGFYVELFAGGNPALAADVNSKRQAANFPLTTVVGAVQIATTGDIDPGLTGMATQEMSVQLSTGDAGTGYAVGDALWLMFSRPDTPGKADIDNVAVSVVPEPATMILLGLGSLVALRSKRK